LFLAVLKAKWSNPAYFSAIFTYNMSSKL